MAASSPFCRVSIPQSAETFFDHHDTETYLLDTCTGERVTGYYRELYSVFHRVAHTKECNEFNKKQTDASMQVNRPGDCVIV